MAHEVGHRGPGPEGLRVLHGDDMSADRAAWAMIAAAAEGALRLPGLSADGVREMRRVQVVSCDAAGLPEPPPLQQLLTA